MSLLDVLRRRRQPAIFICYRRHGEGSGYGGRVADKLVRHFGPEQCFRDVENIEAGVDFVESITHAVDACQVLVVVIGPDWATQPGSDSRPRIEDPADFVRIEVSAALRRNIRVVPVLVGGAELPSEDQLPDDLKALNRRQAQELTDSRWDYDTDRLIETIETIGVKGGHAARKEVLKQRLALGAAVLATVAVVVLGVLLLNRGDESERQSDSTGETTTIGATDGTSSAVSAEAQAALDAERARALEAQLEVERLKRQAAENEKRQIQESIEKPAPPAKPKIPNIAGLWRDADYPSNGSQITQSGNRFDFNGWGYLPNGIEFRSVGNGTLAPDSFSSRYTITYQTGLKSTGTCSGTVSAAGSRMQMTCHDTMLGTFPITSLRQ